MRHVPIAVVLALSVFAPPAVWCAGALSITNYQFISSTPVTVTKANVTYRADLVNSGPALVSVTATLTSLNTASFTVVQGKDTLSFGPVPAGGHVTSSNTFTILVDRSVPFNPNFTDLLWAYKTTALPPVANAGGDQTVAVNTTVTLNGSSSTNPSGIGTLTYQWAFSGKPSGSAATLSNATSVMPTFFVDLAGSYSVVLTVSNGTDSSSATATISTLHSPPIANAGANQTVPVGATAVLNGRNSFDPDGNPLTYQWTLVNKPATSKATLQDANALTPSFQADKFGDYLVQLVVNDGISSSTPSMVAVSTSHTPPVANAGSAQTVNVGTLVQLDGSKSTDPDGNPISYSWSLITRPAGSSAVLNNPTAVNPTFTVDVPGTFVAQLIVSDAFNSSLPATVTISTNAILPPTANAGLNQTVAHGSTVTLSGSGSDPQGLPLTFKWSLISKPAGSVAALSSTSIATPVFVADVPGSYVAQLVVNNGFLNSPASTVTVTTTNTPPVANAGPNQSVPIGATVTLDGSASFDADHDPLTYTWTILSKPAGSTATLTGANTVSPMFVADQGGIYVAQLSVNDGFVNSLTQSTVMIAAGNIVLTPNPLNLTTAGTGQLTITLPFAAGSSGQAVNLSANSAILAVPASVTIPPGSVTTTVTVTPVGPGTTSILATAAGILPGSTNANVTQASISLSPNPISVGLTRTATGTITLNAPAPPAGTNITLSSSDTTVATVTPTVSISGGNTTGSFTVTGVALGSVTITGSAPGYVSGSTMASVLTLGKILLPANASVAPGQSVPYPVTLATGAPADGVTITLSSDSPNATITPSTVFIPAQALTPATQPSLNGVAIGIANITASAPGFNGDTELVTVTQKLSFPPGTLTILGNNTQNLLLQLSSPAAQTLTINLTSSDPSIATVPATVTIQATGTSVNVPVTGGNIKSGSTLITATTNVPGIASATTTVADVFLGQISVPANVAVALGQSAAFPISLPLPASQNGISVGLSSSDTSIVTIAPSSVFIPANATTPAAQPQVNGIAVGSTTVSASASGFGSSSATINVTATVSFGQGSITVPENSTQNATLTLSATTPKPLTINLHSDNTGVATVPATITIPVASNTVSVPITGVVGPGGSTVIHASMLPNIGDATINVTVPAMPAITLPAGITVGPNQSAAFPVSLPAPAASAVTINLNSDNPSVLTIAPSNVVVNAGATSPASQPTVTGVNFGSANITASATGYSSSSQPVVVGATLTFPPGTLNLIAGLSQSVTLTLSAPAPAAGLSVNLASSNTSAVTVPNSVSFAPNSTTASVLVTSLTAGSASVTATTNAPNVTPASLNVLVAAPGALGVPSNVAESPGQSLPFAVTLSPAAPAGGITITLTSSNPAVASVTPSVSIAGGATAPAAQPTVTGVSFGTTTIIASAPGYLATGNATITVGGALSFPAGTTSVSVGATQTIALSLSAASQSDLTVSLNSSNTSVATVPATVTIPANSLSINVPITGLTTGSTTISASANVSTVSSATANVSVVNGIILPANVIAQPAFNSVPFPVSLGQPAPSTVFITLTSSDPTKVALTANGAAATTFTIQAGQTTPSITTRVWGVDFGSATITATASGYSPVSQIVQVRSSVVFVPSPQTIVPGGSKLVSLVMATPAPSGITVNLTSDNPSVATVPSSVTFAANATGACQETGGGNTCQVVITVTGGQVNDSTLIHASAPPFIPDAKATIIVGSPGPPVITTTQLAVGQVGTAYSQQLTADGGIVPFTWALVGGVLPNGLTLDPSTGLISGTPTQTANVDLTFRVTDSSTPNPQSGTATLHLNVLFQGALFITSTSLPNGIQNSPYTATLTAAGGTGPYTWVLAAGSVLPNGLTLNPSTGVISGTPTTLVSNLALTFQVTDSSTPTPQMASKTLSLTILSPTLMITTTSLPDGVVNKPYSATLQATGGVQPYTWSIIVGKLPGFYNLNPQTGVISSDTGAICVCDGNFQMTFQVADSAGHTAIKILSFNITDGSLQLLSTSLPAGQVGVPYSFTPVASAGTPPYSWSVSGLPQDGLSLVNTSTGQISGTPIGPLSTNLKITVTDSSSPQQSVSVFLRLTINNGPPAINTSSLPVGAVGLPYSAPVTAAGGTTPYAWSVSGQPTGLSISASTGVISGTPTAAGSSNNVVVTLTDSSTPPQTATKTFSISIAPQLTITTASLPSGMVNNSYSATVNATGGTSPYTFSLSGQPPGLTINASTGVISGTPTVAGTSNNVVVTVTDSGPPVQTATATFSILIGSGLTITTPSPLPSGVVNTAYSATVAATGGTGALNWSATGLPANLTINSSTGVISGTPSAAGTSSNVVVTVTDSNTPTAHTTSKTFSISIVQPLSITTTSLPAAVVNLAYSGSVSASGGTTPYVFSASGLPANLSINSSTGAITGSATTTGTSSVTITVKDATNPQLTATANLTITVVAPLSVTTTSLPTGTATLPYNATLAASGGTLPYSWSAQGLPSTLTMSSGGQISGTPTAGFSGTVTITVTDSTNPALTATANLTLTIIAPLQITTTSPLASGTRGIAYGGPPIQATGGLPPYTWSATGLPPNLAINSASGQIAGVPLSPGTSSVVITVTDSTSPTHLVASGTFSLTINDQVSITTTSPLQGGTVGVPYSFTMGSAGGTPPYTWSATGLPLGLGINSSTGVISGTPTQAGTSTASITVKDSQQLSATGSFSITIAMPALPIHVGNNGQVSIGNKLQNAVTLSVDSPPTADVILTLTISNVAVAGFPPTGNQQGFQPQLLVALPANVTSIAVNIAGVGIGQTVLNATGSGGGNNYGGAGTITVTPSGFRLSAPNNSQTFTTNQGQPTILTASLVQLDSAGNFLSGNGTLATGLSAVVTLVNSNTSCGTLPASVTFNGGDNLQSVTFTAANTGSASPCSSTLTATPPANFIAPAGNANVVTGNVSGVSCTLPNVTVGRNLAGLANVSLSGQAPAGLQIVIQSTDTSKVQLACAEGQQCSGTLPGGSGASQITMTLGGGATRSANFYVYGIGSSTGTNYTAACGSFGSDTKTVIVNPSGFVIAGPSGPGSPITTGIGSATAAALTISSTVLDPATLAPARDSLGNIMFQPLAGGLAADPVVDLTETDIAPATNVGNISPASVTFTAGQGTASALFTGTSAGKATLAAVRPPTPAGFSTPASQFSTATATVFASSLKICGDAKDVQLNGPFQVGFQLQSPCTASVSQPTSSDLVVTLSSNSNQLLISADPTLAGQQTITVTIPAGQLTSNPYYLQALASTGTATYVGSASGFGSDTGTVTMTQSGIIMSGPNDQFVSFTTPLSGGAVGLNVYLYQLDPTRAFSLGANQALAGGNSLTLSLSDNPGIGTLSSVTITGGMTVAHPIFTPVNTGQTNITLATPAGFTMTGFQTVTATVTP